MSPLRGFPTYTHLSYKHPAPPEQRLIKRALRTCPSLRTCLNSSLSMKTKATLKAVLLLCALAAVAAAQGADDRRGAPGLEVSAFEWKYGGYIPVEVVRSGKSGVELKIK